MSLGPKWLVLLLTLPHPPPTHIFQELTPEVPLKTCIPLIPASPLPVPFHRSFSGIIPLLTLHACQFLDFFFPLILTPKKTCFMRPSS